jgi:energy-coupling factor transporter transmembrane protein EcfT
VDITVVDRSATLGRSRLHGLSPFTKLAATAFVIACVVVSSNVLVLLGVLVALAAVARAERLPMRAMVPLAAYPAIFAAVFAFASAPHVLAAALIIAKAVTAASAVVLLMFTTPYPQVFAAVQSVSPRIVGDGLLLSYRALFLLADKLGSLLIAVRLRSGIGVGHPIRSAAATTRALGGLMLYSIDYSQRQYDVLRLRGYDGRLRVAIARAASPVTDALVLAASASLLAVAVAFRVMWAELNPYSWLVPAVALLALAIAPLFRPKEAR